MRRRSYIIFLVASVVLIALLDIFATLFHLYWMFPRFDQLMHFLGGLWAASLGLWFFFLVKDKWEKGKNERIGSSRTEGETQKDFPSLSSLFITAILSGVLIGVLWEAFELVVDTHGIFGGRNVFDTLNDVLCDLVGALFATPIFVLLVSKRTHPKKH